MMKKILTGASIMGLVVAGGNYLYHALPREPQTMQYRGCEALRSNDGQIYIHSNPVNAMKYVRQLDERTLEHALDFTEVENE